VLNGVASMDDQNIVQPEDTQQVVTDGDGNLDLLLLGPTNIANYEQTVTVKKKFDSVRFKDDISLSGTVLGYQMDVVSAENAAGVKIFPSGLLSYRPSLDRFPGHLALSLTMVSKVTKLQGATCSPSSGPRCSSSRSCCQLLLQWTGRILTRIFYLGKVRIFLSVCPLFKSCILGILPF
jgi:hypothetical protein